VNATEALTFLQAHQPMPPDSELTESLITQYDEARRVLEAEPHEQAPKLLLNSFGDGDGLGVYQLVADTLRSHHRETVIGALQEALQSSHTSVRSWSMEIALEYPDERLDPHAINLLASGSRDERYFAAAYLATRQVPVPRSAVVADGADSELMDLLAELRVAHEG
jgi:hypothetical protein